MPVESPGRPQSHPVAAPAAARMPLGARRLILLGGLAIPVGLVGGPYLLGAQLLAAAGVVLIAVAFSYRATGPWFSKLSWAAAAAGTLWIACSAGYWASLITAADSSAPLPWFTPVLFNAGVACFIVMACASVGGVVLRTVRGRRGQAAVTGRP
ncbi:hypothetical protein LFT45_22890 (plasmid) [Arthrobacter sp. FW305-BF8]|uniref:hypothetical protein n=1 Tax=Arthrobacter sp. FW305-BF8 TaxID=2879617 RepID=UPI001F2F4F69|nr:hypothetical protein [Arthrobacter sp. FW305-BF8]UKA56722.1 hypothetical protein LFT45_22890 [Arthrobacter sp. FW305-BF8]